MADKIRGTRLPRAQLPDTETLRSLLSYDPENGVLTWRLVGTSRLNYRPAGTLDRRGYVRITVRGQRYWAHRIIWKIVHDRDPLGEIDHVNGDKGDNRIANLREAERRQNVVNAPARANSTSRVKGVHRNGNGWMARLKWHGRDLYLGTFATVEEAKAARDAKARELHGEFFRG